MTLVNLRFVFSFFIIVSLTIEGCGSSEGTGGGTKAIIPQHTVAPIDTAQLQKQAKEKENAQVGAQKSRPGAKFTSRQDTLQASVTKKTRGTSGTRRTIVRPDNPSYTVQIGAFKKTQNAVRAQTNAKSRFTDHVVINNYQPNDKMYRVSVGKFDNRKDASRLQRRIAEKFPADYKECWVNYVAK